MSTQEHKKKAPEKVRVAVVTVSTTRTLAEDKSGQWISRTAEKEGHEVVFHQVIPDDAAVIEATVKEVIQSLRPAAVLLTGGTGITPKDVTIEAVRPLFEKELTAFGALFAQLSYEEIDSAALMSRATAGVIDATAVFCMPGSINACKLACKSLIFPELGHLEKHMKEV
ncbi:MAG: molybdenum cofactor biosynthesis protein MoaB [Desulfobacterales bacterium]|nr:molybdenum cofactor biosynthesis protein MoaB [Desulfobacterales bacterium]MDD4071261.1 molybdenum cofactor biosynthesis protein MoaB [Desulfobacterales bacterium]MDD4393285.1 molybdenum cofactor biosynthesis protein MoaB [Desulfobacterales bacterium]